jgi:hypothetical protein
VGASVHDFHSVESKMSLLTRLIHKFRKSVHHEPPEMTAKILDNSDPSNPEPGTCVWRIADSGEISNSPHTGWKPLTAAISPNGSPPRRTCLA